MSDSTGEVHLESFILHMLQMDDGSDEVMTFFSNLLDKHCQDFNDDMEVIDRSAVEVYGQLVNWSRENEA